MAIAGSRIRLVLWLAALAGCAAGPAPTPDAGPAPAARARPAGESTSQGAAPAPHRPTARGAARGGRGGRHRAERAAPAPALAGATAVTEPREADGAPRRQATRWTAPDELGGLERVRLAKAEKLAAVEAMFRDRGVPFPPAELLFRTFKEERELEVWASADAGAAMTHVATYEVCAMSGGPGPKRAEGDRQVPEGFYRIAYFWPESAYHLSANVGYPNASDKILGGPRPGGEIMIHGRCASIGCIAVTDERIQELYVMSAPLLDRGERVHVHIFPARDVGGLLAREEYAQHRRFWENLREGMTLFDADHRIPAVSVDWQGRYVFRPAGRRGR